MLFPTGAGASLQTSLYLQPISKYSHQSTGWPKKSDETLISSNF